jgi:hypothetical protein
MSGNELRYKVIFDAMTAALEKAVQQLQRLGREADQLDRKDVNIDVDVDTAKAEAKIGYLAKTIQARLQSALRAIPDIDVDADVTDAQRKLAGLAARMKALSDAKIGVDMDEAEALRDIEIIRTELRRLSTESAEIDVRVDSGKALAELEAIAAAVNKNDQRFVEFQKTVANTQREFDAAARAAEKTAAATEKIRLKRVADEAREASREIVNIDRNVQAMRGRLTEVQKVMLAVVGLFPIIAAAIVGLPAAFMALATPIAAVALGVEGIKAAVAPLADEFARMQEFVSAAFEQGLAPAVANIAGMMSGLTEILGETAERMSLVAFAISEVVSEGSQGLDDLFQSMNNINDVIGIMAPGMADLVANFLSLARAGTEAMIPFAAMFNQVGETWTRVIDQMNSTGSVEAAVLGLLQLFAALLDVLAPLTALGAQFMAVLGPPLAAALLAVSAVLQPLVAAFAQLPTVLQTAIAAALMFRAVMAILGRSLDGTKKSAAEAGQAMAKSAQATQQAAQATQTAATRMDGIRASLTGVATAYRTGAQAGQTFGAQVAASASQAAAALSNTLVGGAERAGRAVIRLGESFVALGQTFSRVGSGSLFAGFEKSLIAGEQAVARLGSAIASGVRAVDTGMAAMGRAVATGVNAAGDALMRLPELGGRAMDALVNTTVRGAAALNSGLNRAFDGVVNGARAIHTGLDSAVGAVGRFVTSGNQLSTVMNAAGNVARSFGTTMSNLGVSLGTGLAGAVQRIPVVVDAATGAFTRFSGVVGGVARGAVAGMSSAVSGLMGALGGPWGAAITGATVLLGIWGQQQQEAAQKAAQHKAAVDALASALQQSNGAITANVEALAAKQAEEAGLIKSSQALGISARDLTLAITGQGNAYQDVMAHVKAAVTAQDGFAVGINASTVALNAANPGLVQLAKSLGLVTTETLQTGAGIKTAADRFKEAQESAKRMDEAMRGAAASFGPVAAAADASQRSTMAWATAMKTLGESTSTTKEKIDGFAATFQTASEGARSSLEALKEANEALGKFGESIGRITPGLINMNGTINTSSVAGRQLATAVLDTAKSFDQLFGATVTTLQQQGVQMPQAFGQAAAATLQYRENLIQTAVAHGATRSEAEALVNTYFKFPPEIATTFSQPGMLEAMANALGLKVSVNDIPGDKEVRVSSPMTPALIAQLDALGLKVTQIPGTKDVVITAKDEVTPAIGAIVGKTYTASINVATPNAAAQDANLTNVARPRDQVDTVQTPNAGAVDSQLTNVARPRDQVDNVQAPNAGAVDSQLNNVARDRTVTITVGVRMGTVATGSVTLSAGGIAFPFTIPYIGLAKGGVINRYDRGGVEPVSSRRNLRPLPGGTPRVVPPGAWRIIGDNPRVPESYIPWERNKRTAKLLETTANALGFGVVPMANGGVHSAVRTPQGGSPAASTQVVSNAEVVAELRATRDLIERRGVGTSQIVVEDRSGDPIETARQTRLAMRLA